MADRGWPPVDEDGATVARQLPEDDLGQLGAAGPDQSGEPDHFTGANLEADVSMPVAVDVLGLEHHAVGRGSTPLEDGTEIPANHQLHDLALRQSACRLDGDELAVAKDRHPGRETQDLLDAVRDIDDGQAVVAEPANEREQAIDLFVGEGGGWLVEGENPNIRLERSKNLDQLALSG